jgi:hypothetical protein
MEELPRIPRSLTNIRRIKPVSPASVRMLKQLVINHDPSKFINLSSTVRHLNSRPIAESPELTFQLATLRKNLDKYYLQNLLKTNRIKELQTRLKEMNDSQAITEEEIQKKNYYHQLKVDIKNAKIQEMIELEDQKVYEFMGERLRYTKKFLEKKEKKLRKELESTLHDADLQGRLRKETRDSVLQFKNAFRIASETVDYEKMSLINEISRMETQSKLKKSMIAKTEEHNRHRLEIIELTMIDDRSAHLEDIRKKMLLHKWYYKALAKKLITEKVNFTRLEEAFLKVKIQTGLVNVEEVIEKFLTQEANYKQVVDSLHTKELECSEYHEKIQKMQKKVAKIGQEKVGKKIVNEEVKNMIEKNLRAKEKKFEIDKAFLKINVWIENALKKIDKSVEFEAIKGLSMKKKFELLKEIIREKRKELSSDQENRPKSMKLDEIVEFYISVQKLRKFSHEKLQPAKSSQKQRSNHNLF